MWLFTRGYSIYFKHVKESQIHHFNAHPAPGLDHGHAKLYHLESMDFIEQKWAVFSIGFDGKIMAIYRDWWFFLPGWWSITQWSYPIFPVFVSSFYFGYGIDIAIKDDPWCEWKYQLGQVAGVNQYGSSGSSSQYWDIYQYGMFIYWK